MRLPSGLQVGRRFEPSVAVSWRIGEEAAVTLTLSEPMRRNSETTRNARIGVTSRAGRLVGRGEDPQAEPAEADGERSNEETTKQERYLGHQALFPGRGRHEGPGHHPVRYDEVRGGPEQAQPGHEPLHDPAPVAERSASATSAAAPAA